RSLRLACAVRRLRRKPCRTAKTTCRRSRSASGVSPSTPARRVRGGPSGSPFDVVESLLEREPFGHLPHDLPRADEVPFELREPEDFRREAALATLREDPFLAVDLV